jgi:hypothetical protein
MQLAEAADTTVERLQCYEGINEEKAIGKFDESLQRLCVELRAKSADADWEPLQAELHRQEFFSAGPLLRALQYEKPRVLLIAETKNPGLVKEVMGHESLSTTMGYLHPETAQIKVVIDRLNQQKYVM